MTRPGRRPRSGNGRGAGGAKRAPRRPRLRFAAIAALLLIAAAVALRTRAWRPSPPPDPLAGLSPAAAGDSADRLVRSGHPLEALPFLAHFERHALHTTADYEGGFATAYSNATVQVRELRGLAVPVTRSSIERLALLRESMRRLDNGERKATNPEQLRNIIVARAGQLAVWGFVREGYAEYRRAHSIRPLDAHGLGEAGWLEKMFIDPTVVLPPPPAADPSHR